MTEPGREATRGARRYHEPQECPDCGKTVATLVPWHGDGSIARFVAHGPVKDRCPGSRTVPPGYAAWWGNRVTGREATFFPPGWAGLPGTHGMSPAAGREATAHAQPRCPSVFPPSADAPHEGSGWSGPVRCVLTEGHGYGGPDEALHLNSGIGWRDVPPPARETT